jgi:dolichol-phosphate mannosyltransferase
VAQDGAAALTDFVEAVSRVLAERFRYYELLVIDNGSTDHSLQLVLDLQHRLPSIRLIRLSRRYPLDITMVAALDNAVGDYVIVLDYRTDGPELVPAMVDRLISGDDVVIGQQVGRKRSAPFRIASAVSRWLIRRILKTRLEPDTGMFSGFTRRAVNSITRIRSKSRFLLFDTAVVGYRRSTMPYVPRGAGFTSESFLSMVFRRMELITAHSALPLRFASLLGFVASFLNLLYLGYIFTVAIIKDRVAEGWLTTSLTQTVMFLLLFIILTVLAEYISRILEETKDQPLYFVESETNSTVSCYDRDRLNIV